MRKGDRLLIILMFIGVLCYFTYQYLSQDPVVEGKMVVISIDGEVYQQVPLEEEGSERTLLIENEYGTNEILIDHEGAMMIHADCPDQICIHSGKITSPGPLIVCLPHRLTVEIVGQSEDELDAISQ